MENELIKQLLKTEACRLIEEGEQKGMVQIMLRDSSGGYKRNTWLISIKKEEE